MAINIFITMPPSLEIKKDLDSLTEEGAEVYSAAIDKYKKAESYNNLENPILHLDTSGYLLLNSFDDYHIVRKRSDTTYQHYLWTPENSFYNIAYDMIKRSFASFIKRCDMCVCH